MTTPTFMYSVMDESHNAWNLTPANQISQVPAFNQFAPREVLFGTIHYWGDPAPTFDEVISFFCDGPGKGTSAHMVVEAGRSASIVSPDDIAWACGNAYGNVKSISYECNPRASDEDYLAVAELVRFHRSIYGDFPLVPHNHWVSTSCPGPWDVNRVDALARNLPSPSPAPAPAPAPTPVIEDEMVFLAKLPDDNAVYVSNGIWYRHVQDPATLDSLKAATGLSTIVEVANLGVLGVPADYVTGPQFKADFFTGASQAEKDARAAFEKELVAQVPSGTATVDAQAVASDVVTELGTKHWGIVS